MGQTPPFWDKGRKQNDSGLPACIQSRTEPESPTTKNEGRAMSFDWKKTLATIAPALATALGGPLAGVAVQTISGQLLGKPDGSEAEIAAAIQTGGADALLKLKQAEQDFTVRMRELDLDLDRIHAGDRANARDRQAKTGDHTPSVLAGVITVGFFSVLLFMLLRGVPQTGGEALLVLLGALGAAWGSVVSYYYGSSRGSAEKTQLLGKAGKPN